MKKLIIIIIALLFPAMSFAADTKGSALSAPAGGVARTDKVYVIDDPAGTPVSTADTIANLLGLIQDSDIPTTLTLETISGTPAITNGVAIGTDDTNHLIDEATNGAGSATLYIGNESILVSGDIGVSVQGYNANTTILGATIGASEVDADIATQAELDAVAALVDTDDEIIAIINASPSTQIGVPAGGTGAGTFTDGGLLVGAGTGAFEALAVGLTTQVLVGGGAGTNPVWGTDLPTAVTIGGAYIYRVGGTAIDDDNVAFDDANSDWTATAIGPALEEMVNSINGGVPNSATAKVHWSQLTGVPAGFADGVDADSGGTPALSAVTDLAANKAFDNTSYTLGFTNAITASDTYTFGNTAAIGDISVFKIIHSTGNATDGTLLELVQTDTDIDPIDAKVGGSSVFNLNSSGVLTLPAGGGVIVTPNDTAAQYSDYHSDTDDGPYYHRVQGQAFSSNRLTLLPDYNAALLASDQVDSGGDLADNSVDIEHINSADRSGSDTTLVTGTAGTNTYVAVWNADGDLVAGAGAPLISGGDAGTPSAINLTNATAYPAATTSASGISELAIASEVNTGTDATRAVTPDALAGSTYGTVFVTLRAYEPGTALATGDGKDYWTVPPELNGWNLVSVFGAVYTVSSSGTPTFQIHNLTDTQDMLSTVLTIDANEFNSSTAATPAVIDTSYDDVATGDIIRIDVDVAGTSTTGGDVILGFRLP